MELISAPNTDYLLNASLESLHTESVSWLNELAFWTDEMSFFYHLLHHKTFSQSFPSAETADIQKELIKLVSEKLDRVKALVTSHEHQLAYVYKSTSIGNEQVYREAHSKLFDKMRALHDDIRTFKMKVFSFIGK